MFYYEVAEVGEYLYMTVLCPLAVLLTAVIVEKLIAYGQLCQQSLITVGQLFVSVVGNDDELADCPVSD